LVLAKDKVTQWRWQVWLLQLVGECVGGS